MINHSFILNEICNSKQNNKEKEDLEIQLNRIMLIAMCIEIQVLLNHPYQLAKLTDKMCVCSFKSCIKFCIKLSIVFDAAKLYFCTKYSMVKAGVFVNLNKGTI